MGDTIISTLTSSEKIDKDHPSHGETRGVVLFIIQYLFLFLGYVLPKLPTYNLSPTTTYLVHLFAQESQSH